MSEKNSIVDLTLIPSPDDQVFESQTYEHDPVFGEIKRDGPKYRNVSEVSACKTLCELTFHQVGWLGTAALMMKSQIGLGVLSIPIAFDTLGIVPGVFILCAIAAITTWSNYVVGTFKLRHREVYGIGDMGGLLFGRPGRIFFGIAFCLCQCTLK